MNKKYNTMSETLFRIRTELKRYVPLVPYDMNEDHTVFGTGFVVEWGGTKYILTCHHVVQNAVRVTATTNDLPDGQARELTIVGLQPHLDVAILTATDSDLHEFLQSAHPFRWESRRMSSLSPKDRVTVLGFANADRHLHITTGTVSGRTNWPLNRIQTDAVVNEGNSGGPVVDDDNVLLGIVTSGMHDMQSTNHFVPFDEVLVALERFTRSRAKNVAIVRDLGLFINAVLIPVESSGTFDMARGALVADAMAHTHLQKGDVITSITFRGEARPLDAHMMIEVEDLWKSHRVDFRVVLDHVINSDTIPVTVFREGNRIELDVELKPDLMASRQRFPDCEPLVYIMYCGLVIQMLNEDHLWDSSFRGRCEEELTDAHTRIASYPVVTHVLPGSPFELQDSVLLKGRRIRKIHHTHGTRDIHTTEVDNLHDIMEVIREIPPGADVVIELKNGARVGASANQIGAFVRKTEDDHKNSRMEDSKMHRVFLPFWNQVNYDTYEGDGTPLYDLPKVVIVETEEKEDNDDESSSVPVHKVSKAVMGMHPHHEMVQTRPYANETKTSLVVIASSMMMALGLSLMRQ